MPYIAIKCYPKEETAKKAAVDRLMELLPELLDCPPQALTISIEEYSPEEFREKVRPEMEAKEDRLWVSGGEKKYE